MSGESAVRDGAEASVKLDEQTDQGPDYQLIETMRWEPLSGVLRLDLHMARLEGSANELGFDCDMMAIRQKIEAAGTSDQALKLRLTLAPDGLSEIIATPFEPLPQNTVWRIAIASTRLRHDDPLLRHKTTRRRAYIAAREEYSLAEVDEVILLNERDELCEGTITSIFLDTGDATFATPALSSGLLDGVLRREILNNGIATETPVSVKDLKKARTILVGNSLRGMIRAKLIDIDKI
ncbi:aminotransferase class IV family protein [Brucella sp. BE17]|uniref:aminotransferase class IV family protein n=1 Tax=Brucella sp. BE17 TaxID=3142977 RepID=UPI0031BACF6C